MGFGEEEPLSQKEEGGVTEMGCVCVCVFEMKIDKTHYGYYVILC